MEIKLREQVRLKDTGKIGTIIGWERKLSNGMVIERYTVRLEETVPYWYPCSAVGEMVPGFREVKVHESQIQRMRLDPNEDYLDAMRYAIANMQVSLPKKPFTVKTSKAFMIDTSQGAITVQIPETPEHRWFSIRDQHGVREYHPKTPVCECGKEKHGFASHSDWCQKKDNT